MNEWEKVTVDLLAEADEQKALRIARVILKWCNAKVFLPANVLRAMMLVSYSIVDAAIEENGVGKESKEGDS